MGIVAMLRRVWTARASRKRARRSKRRHSHRLTFHPVFDVLEDRLAPATVTNISNSSAVIGSLPWAVNQANIDTSGTTITIDFDPVVFATPQTIMLAGTLNLGNGTPGKAIIIDGPAAPLTIQGGGSGSNFSVIAVAGNTTATLENLTISNGHVGEWQLGAGGIFNNGTLTVSNSTISGNSVAGLWFRGGGGTGGGIYNVGTLTVSNSTISANSAEWRGGGIWNSGMVTVSNSTLSANSVQWENGGGGGIENWGTVTVSDSALSANSAGWGGGGICNFGTVTVTNSTLSANSARSLPGGGGIYNQGGTVTVSNSTLSGNSAQYGGGISNIDNYGYSGTVALLNTIVAGNTGYVEAPEIYGPVITASAYNLIGDGTGMTGISNGDANHNQVGTSSSPIDPLLADLGNYGGPTQTMALRPDSPALSAGEIVDGITTDQRGYPRPTSNPDIARYQSSFFVNYPPLAGLRPPLAGPAVVVGGTTSIVVGFAHPVIGGDVADNYELRSVGADGLLGTADDPIIPHTVIYTGTTATLSFAPLPESVYRLTVKDTITDSDGNPLDGDGDGTAGGNYVRDFVVSGTPASLMFGSVSTFDSGGRGACPWSAAVADVNKDGNPNIVVANYDSNNVGVLLGNGTGGFGSATTFASGGNFPDWVAVADVNNDGNPDIVVANADYTDKVGVLLGNGKGGFGSVTTFASGGITPEWLAVKDVNHDGNPDIIVANGRSNNVGVLLGNGTGGFGSATTFASGGYWPFPVAVADVNNDGNPDIIVANNMSPNVGVLLGNGTGGFGSATTFASGGYYTRSVAVADVNKDGNPDILVTNDYSDNVGVLLGNGTGGFGSVTTFASGGDWPNFRVVAVADINQDGNPDIVTNSSSGNVGVLLGDGTGGFGSVTTFAASGSGSYSVAVADVNKDGNLDIVVANYGSDSVGVLLGNGPPVADLYTPKSFLFDIRETGVGAGQFLQGTRNAFDGDNRLQVGSQVDGQLVWSDFQPDAGVMGPGQTFLDDGGRTVVTPVQTLAGLNVHREITVPLTPAPLPSGGERGEDFARTVDVFENPTDSPITTTVHIVGNLGSDAATTVFTPDGGTTPDVNDQWIGTDDADGSGTPAIIHYIHGPFGLKPTAVNVTGDNIDWTYTITVNPGATVRLATFTILSTWRADAIAAADALVTPSGFGGQAAVYLSTDEIDSLVNFYSALGTTTTVTSSSNPSVYGQSVTFTATVSASGFDNGGTVTFSDGGTSLGTASLSSGQATLAATASVINTLGTHTITASYSGDTNFNGSSGSMLQMVTTAGTTTTVTSSTNPSVYGQSVTFTATVSASGFDNGGTVTFSDGSTSLGTVGLSGSSTATFSTTAMQLSGGTHTITASYSGDTNFTASSGSMTQTVTGVVVTLTSSPNPSTPDQQVTFSVTVAGPGTIPTGTVTFSDGSTSLGSTGLQGGSSSFSVSSLTLGTHTIRASYSGDMNNPAGSGTTVQYVAKASTTTLTSSSNPSAFNESVTFTATVSGVDGTPTGIVTFVDNGGFLGVRPSPRPLSQGERGT